MDRKCLSLRPIPAAVQRVAVYETRTLVHINTIPPLLYPHKETLSALITFDIGIADMEGDQCLVWKARPTYEWLYIVGSTNDGTCCRLLKLDRTLPSPSSPELCVEEIGVYSEMEIKEMLIMLDNGNKYSANKYKAHGLKQLASAFGIIGFIQFLEGYYIVLITKRKPVATIGGHVVYKIEDTMILPVTGSTIKSSNPDEAKYLKIFQNVDLSSNFYFSYSYDLTLSLQCQMRTYPGPAPPPCRKFIWNDHMLRQFEGYVHPKWILHIMHGFVGQYNISVFGRPIYLTMIARRSKEFAGTRFLKRGANDEGHVANEVETEQLVHDATSSLHANGRYTSYLQLRGSVPSFWSQDLAGIKPKPQITIDRATPFASPAALHFMACLKRFGSPIVCLNLVKKREHRKRESLLSEELLAAIDYLNQFLPPEHHIQYIHKDMARINKSKTHDLIEILERIADDVVKSTGFFHSGPERYCNKLHPHPDYKAVGGYGYRDDYIGRDQTGVLRVNCVDCLDRTNTAQFIAGKCVLGYQLYALGVLPEPSLPFDCDTIRILEEAYEDLGDTLAVQYGGSQLVHRIQTYRKVAPMANHGRDIYQTIHRYYRNAFQDSEKQMAINVFLGVFQPWDGSCNIWELSTDYYLHHTNTRVPPTSRNTHRHKKWWKDRLMTSLPLPQLEVDDEDEEEVEEGEGGQDSKLESFDEVYKPLELTDFDGLFSKNITRTPEHDCNDASPFVVRAKPKRKLPRKALRVAIVGSPSPPEGDPDSGSSSDGSSEEEGPATLPATPLKSLPSSGTPNPAEMSTMEAYGFEIQEPSLSDCLLYERYAHVHSTACVAWEGGEVELTSELVNNELAQWKPTYPYKNDSVFCVEPPVVSPEDMRVYEQSVRVATMGPQCPTATSLELYSQYADIAARTT